MCKKCDILSAQASYRKELKKAHPEMDFREIGRLVWEYGKKLEEQKRPLNRRHGVSLSSTIQPSDL